MKLIIVLIVFFSFLKINHCSQYGYQITSSETGHTRKNSQNYISIKEHQRKNWVPSFGLPILSQYDILPSRHTPLDMHASEIGSRIVAWNIRSFYFQFRPVTIGPEFVNGDSVVVSTQNGQVQGIESVTDNSNRFFVFLGMRYAEPPIGKLRFRAPLPVSNWTGVYNATQEGENCVQSSLGSTTVEGSEDCLFINVYTNQLPSDAESTSRPVMVWIPGGGYMYFSGNLGLHGADKFLDRGVVVVSLNYRLGLFGFLSTEDSIMPGNYGIKDQLLALQWVQQNIASFGGDPNKVTIFGQSAGASSVHFLRQSKRAKKMFRYAIANSGNTLCPWSNARNARETAFRIGLENGILTANSTTLVNRLQKVDFVQLQRSTVLSGLVDLFDIFNGLPFAPVLEEQSDEAVFTRDSYVAQEEGDFNPGPLLHGFNSLELRDYTQVPWFGLPILAQYDIFPSRLTPLDMHASETGRRIVGWNIRSFYFQFRPVTIGPNFAYYASDNVFVRGILKSNQLESRFTNVYLYQFSFTGGVTHTSFEPEGVSHAEETQFLFLRPETMQITPSAQLTMERMVEMWSNFVKTGNPTPQISAAVNVIWPLTNATGYNTVHYLDIGDKLVTNINPEKKQMQFWDDQYSRYGTPPYNTY